MRQTRPVAFRILETMSQTKTNKRRDKARLKNITKEMAQPRMAKSARIAEHNRAAGRHEEPLKKGEGVDVTVTAKRRKSLR